MKYLDKNGLEACKEKIGEKIKITRGTMQLDNAFLAGVTYTIPVNYKVGKNRLELYYCGQKLCKGIDYNEVGATGTMSNKVSFTETIGDFDMSGVPGFENFTSTLELVLRGTYE